MRAILACSNAACPCGPHNLNCLSYFSSLAVGATSMVQAYLLLGSQVQLAVTNQRKCIFSSVLSILGTARTTKCALGWCVLLGCAVLVYGFLSFLPTTRLYQKNSFFDRFLLMHFWCTGKLLFTGLWLIRRRVRKISSVWFKPNKREQKGHYHLFPKALGQLINKYSVQELHLAFSAGRWAENWGLPIVTAPVGAELRVWLNSSTPESRFGFESHFIQTIWFRAAQWRGLTNALSGVFCASLNFMDEAHTTHPSASFPQPPASEYQKLSSPSTYPLFVGSGEFRTLHYASLPREVACTENLTPWAKVGSPFISKCIGQT